MSQVSYGTITITDTTDLTTYIRYAKKIGTGMIESDFQETPTTDTHYIAVLNIPSSDSIPTWNSDKWKWSEFVGTDGVSVLGTREIYYLKTNSSTVTAPSNGSDIAQTSEQVENQWTKSVPTYVTNGEYWSCIQTHLDGSPTWVYSVPILNQALTDMNYNAAMANSIAQHANEDAQGAMSQAAAAQQQVTQIDTLLGGHFLWHGSALSANTKAGARVVEQVKENGTDISGNPAKWLHNVNIGANGIQLRYNEAVMAQLAATNPDSSNDIALKFYQPPAISGNTTTQGNLTMALKGNALTFYDPTVANGQSVQATLDANGLKLLKGGIESGDLSSGNGYVYLSTEDKAGIEINGHLPDNEDPKWRQIIGTNFGVDANGNLYAGNVNITGSVTIAPGSNSNVYTMEDIDGQMAEKLDTDNLATSINAVADEIRLSADNIYLGEKSVEDSMGELTSTIAIDTDPDNPNVRIGSTDGFNIQINNQMLGFYYGIEQDPIAYISGSQLYISQSVVLQQMDVGNPNDGLGQWSWKVHENHLNPNQNNLCLKWIG